MIAWSDESVQREKIGPDGTLRDNDIIRRELLAAFFAAQGGYAFPKPWGSQDGAVGQLVARVKGRSGLVVGRELAQVIERDG